MCCKWPDDTPLDNAKLLSGELATLLAGRYVEIRVYPLDFREYLDFAAENPEESSLSQQEQFANFLRFEGLPGIHQMKWEETRVMQYLHDIYNSVLLKDVIARNKIRDTALLESVIAYLMDNIGNTFSAKTITDFLKNQGRKLSAETVYNYLRALESAFLIHKAVRFDIKGKRILKTQEKYYLSDGDFFRNAPAPNPNRKLITGSICGVKVETIEDPLMQEIRYLDKLVDELAKGKAMEKVLRK